MALRAVLGSVVLAVVSFPTIASADIQHTIGRGQTIEAIAHRYHVTIKSILEANQIPSVKRLRVGDVLTIPGVTPKEKSTSATAAAGSKGAKSTAPAAATSDTSGKPFALDHKRGEKTAMVGKTNGRETTTFAMKPKTPGVIHVHRLATSETFDIAVGERRGRVSPVALKTAEKMMRSPAGLAHPIDPRLVSLLGVVSNHFGSRKLEVVSGFRPFTPTQFNPHSNHMHGKAVDFRVQGVPNEAVRDFCRTLKNVGCGYYPNSVFVHMDVRDQSAFWIDYSKPGEAPRYNAPDTNADEGTSDVQEEAHAPAAAPSDSSSDSQGTPSVTSEAPTSPLTGDN